MKENPDSYLYKENVYLKIIMCQAIGPEQDGQYVIENIFECIFPQERNCNWIQIWLKFARQVPIDNKWAFVSKYENITG